MTAECVLVTGGAGYIGSHMCVALAEKGYRVISLDNFSNSERPVVGRLGRLTSGAVKFVEGDIRDESLLGTLFKDHGVEAVMHFAGLKAVGESTQKPLEYFSHNVGGSISLLRQMHAAGVRTLVFSSSATVYGDPRSVPISETAPTMVTNPYGRSKLAVEHMLADLYASDPSWRIACLRYFNPVGAHESGQLGESPRGVPNNLMPYIVQVASGRRPRLSIFGGDYPTPDGTGIRDYVHILDLVDGHLAALEHLKPGGEMLTVNLGTGQGVSVLEMVRAFESSTGQSVPHEIVARRPGDVAECFADVSLSREVLGWRATRSLADMCTSSWQWASTEQKS